MADYVTTNIRLPREAFRTLKLRAAQTDRSLAELIRQAVREVYGGSPEVGSRERPTRHLPLEKLSGICRTGVRDGSVHHDRDIYGV